MDESRDVDSKCIHVQIIPILRFASERDITIKGCKIRKLREDEKQKIRNSTALKLAWPEAERATFDFDFVIESSHNATLLAQDIIAALRIFKPFAVSTFPHIDLEIRNGETIHIHSAQFFASLYDTTNGSVYALSEKEAEEFEEFCKLFFKAINRAYMRTAINRFSNAYRKGFGGDRLVDYVIALEALFSENSEEIGYKLRLRVPMFLGIRTEIGERIRIREYVKTAYEIRSGIVHGSEAFMKLFPKKMKKLGSQLEKKLQCKLAINEQNFFSECFLPEIREITRKAIYGFITQSGRCLLDKTLILETIDDALLPTDK
jgi:hypothetical protein